MSTTFYPSAREGQDLDLAVRQAFKESLVWCHNSLPKSLQEEFPIDRNCAVDDLFSINAPQFGFYYSLSTALTLWDDTTIKARTHELGELWLGACGQYSQKEAQKSACAMLETDAEMKILQLNESFYSAQEISCLNLWLDMEPENSIGLSALETEEFMQARNNLLRALKVIKEELPDFYDEMSACIREIILAKPSGQQKMTFGGVSSFALWGALCLNIEAHSDWRAYIPSLIHEYSHNVLFAKAMHGPLVNNDPQAGYFSPLRESLRPMDGIYHAAFVSAREALAAQKLLSNTPLMSDEGMRSFFEATMQRSAETFNDCLVSIRSDGQLSELGQAILDRTSEAMHDLGVAR